MDEISKIAHSVKARLEHLQRDNQAALERKASSALLQLTALSARCTAQSLLAP